MLVYSNFTALITVGVARHDDEVDRQLNSPSVSFSAAGWCYIHTNELSSKDGRALGDELGEDQECWHCGSDGHILVSDVNKGAELRPTVRHLFLRRDC